MLVNQTEPQPAERLPPNATFWSETPGSIKTLRQACVEGIE